MLPFKLLFFCMRTILCISSTFHILALGEDVKETTRGKTSFPHRPIIREGYPRNTTAVLGGRAVLECRVLFDPHPDLLWIKHLNGSYASPEDAIPSVSTLLNGTSSTLVLDPVSVEDQGFYTCLASNTVGVSFRSAYLSVLEPPVALVVGGGGGSEVLVAAIAVLVAAVAVVVVVAWRVRRRGKSVGKLLEEGRLAVKKTVRVVDSEDSSNPLVPLLKIDYNPVYTSSSELTTPFQEYELPLDPLLEFPRDQLTLGPLLGEGAFARVVRAEARWPGLHTTQTVAVKMLREDHVDTDLLALFSEIQLMKNLGKHVNVVSLLGCCTQGGPLYAIMEYAEKGNLRDYLRHHRAPSSPDPEGYEVPLRHAPTSLPTSTLVSLSLQAAKGMRYLSSKGCVHRDLAARNVLLTADDVIKIGDFGLSRELHDSEYYRKTTQGKLPVKWMAPESLCERVYTTQSDVWSYGVLLYEIFTLGATPYPTLGFEELLQKLKSGHRMEKPDACPINIYLLMRRCWKFSPTERPTFEEIVGVLEDMLMESSKTTYLQFGMPFILTPENSSDEEC